MGRARRLALEDENSIEPRHHACKVCYRYVTSMQTLILRPGRSACKMDYDWMSHMSESAG